MCRADSLEPVPLSVASATRLRHAVVAIAVASMASAATAWCSGAQQPDMRGRQDAIGEPWSVTLAPPVHGVALTAGNATYAILKELSEVRRYSAGAQGGQRVTVTPPIGTARFVPSAVVSDGKRVVLLDRRNRLIASGGPRDTMLAAVPLQKVNELQDACLLGREVALFSADSGGRISIVRLDGSFVRRYDVSEGHVPSPLEARMDNAHIVCDGGRGQVVVLEDRRSRVRAFGRDGAKRWETMLTAYRPIGFRLLNAREALTTVPDGGYHGLYSAFLTRQGTLRVQLVLTTKESIARGAAAGFQSYALDARTGRELARQVDSHAVLTGDESSQLVLEDTAVRSQSLTPSRRR